MKTIIELLENSEQKYRSNTYLLEKKSDRIALSSESRTDWVISELGIIHAGASIYPSIWIINF